MRDRTQPRYSPQIQRLSYADFRHQLSLCGLLLITIFWAPGAWAQSSNAGPDPLPGLGGAGGQANAANDSDESNGCVENWPQALPRPSLKESVPSRAIAGHRLTLEIELIHRPGERPLVDADFLIRDENISEQMQEAQLSFLAEGSPYPVEVNQETIAEEQQNLVRSAIKIPFVTLPKDAGRHTLRLPSLPLKIARASGEVHRLCTFPHSIEVEDALASSEKLTQAPPPAPRPQLELWKAARDISYALLVALPLALLSFLLWLALRARFKKELPPPPPRPAWEIAQERLHELAARDLLSEEEFEKYLAEITSILREYLGNRYGFDGLESTTSELLDELRLASSLDLRPLQTTLERTDLVKFAQLIPSKDECLQTLALTEDLIQRTRPVVNLDPREPSLSSEEKKR
ncbi:MAG: hypothetical protein MK135_10360 [Polyangiaceae bacterium]|nr:hypothetical protein [Polyangiaceae bacterium]